MIRTDEISNPAGGPVQLTGQSAAKAWGRMDGAANLSILNSFNMASLLDSGVGAWTWNYANVFATTNPCTSLEIQNADPSDAYWTSMTTASSMSSTSAVYMYNTNYGDRQHATVAYGELA